MLSDEQLAEIACTPKWGFITGEKYCAVHGRAAGWPCSMVRSLGVTE